MASSSSSATNATSATSATSAVSAYDAIVIGSGQAGPSVAARLAAGGARTALIEREHLGGTCVNDGCMPTKALVASARAAHIARRGADFGVVIGGPVSVDLAAVKARKDALVAQSQANLARWLDATPGLDLHWGHARFVGPHAVEAAGRVFEAPRIFVNVGGRAVLPEWPGIDRVPVLTHTTLLQLERLPEHLVVVGASYIGLEFAQIYRRFGSRVTVLEHATRPLAGEDREVSHEVQRMLEAEGVRFHLAVRDVVVSANRLRVQIEFDDEEGPQWLDASHLLAAVGRRPNTDDLGLDRAGIATDASGFITVDEQLRTNVPGVWALGDVNGRGAFTHTSYNDHEIVLANLLDGDARRVGERIAAYALFTDPPLARIGLNDRQARALGRPVLVGMMPMSRVGRARERSETQGFMRVLVDAQSERILGATLLGIEADEVIHALLDVMAAGASYRVIRRAMHIHPTVSELIPTLLGNLRPLEDALCSP